MNWRNPKTEMPKEDQAVGVIYQHNKEHRFFSSQVMFGEVEYNRYGKNPRVNSNDFVGHGSWCVYFDEYYESEKYGTSTHEDVVLAWIPIEEFEMPDWIPHDKHWGPVFK
jgi:hypothetical protein